ncbi:MAG: substrate-binding domain-containing protein [Solirubrobacteraceae bacterium]
MRRKSNRAIAAAVAAMVIGGVTACGSSNSQSSNTQAANNASASSSKVPPIDFGPYCGPTCQKDLTLQAPQSSVNFKVGFALDATSFPYGAAMDSKTAAAAKKFFPNMKMTILDGNNDPATQAQDVGTLVNQGIKVLIINAVTAQALVPAVKQAVAAGVKVVSVDRTVNTPVLTTVKAPDVPLGERAAQFIVSQLHGHGNVAILSGTPGASPTISRTTGFMNVVKNYPGIKVVANVNGNYDGATAAKVVDDLLSRFPAGKLDAIYSEADVMSLGAIQSIKAAGRAKSLFMVSIDGQQQALQAIQAGDLLATVVYPVVVPEDVIAAAKAGLGESMPTFIPLDYPLVTKDNVQKYLGTNFG